MAEMFDKLLEFMGEAGLDGGDIILFALAIGLLFIGAIAITVSGIVEIVKILNDCNIVGQVAMLF